MNHQKKTVISCPGIVFRSRNTGINIYYTSKPIMSFVKEPKIREDYINWLFKVKPNKFQIFIATSLLKQDVID